MSSNTSRRVVKVTTTEQFDLLKYEMLQKPEAAVGYCRGVDRAKADAQWKEIVEKLNALGPPHKTMSEWKKVWSDVRLRLKKRIGAKVRRRRKTKTKESESDEDFISNSMQNSQSVYDVSQSMSSNENHLNDHYEITEVELQPSYDEQTYQNGNYEETQQLQQPEINTETCGRHIRSWTHKKKTTDRQFRLLHLEMARHPSAAGGYNAGVDRQQADEEWKEIVEKLNAIGPPYRSISEWKKVWSDARLRLKKRMCKNSKTLGYFNVESGTDDDLVMEPLNNSIYSISSYDDYDGEEPNPASFVNVCQESVYNCEANHHSPAQPKNQSIDEEAYCETKDNKNHLHSILNIPNHTQDTQNNPDASESTAFTLQYQMQQNNMLMQHLIGISTTLTNLLERHVTATEKMTQIMERQSRRKDFNSFMQRRRENRTKTRMKKFYEFF